jgi:uncharacterized delta-60 repeat protein
MTTSYKILGQGINSLKINAPENGSTILSELKIKNSSYPTRVDVMCSSSYGVDYFLDENFDIEVTSGGVNTVAFQSDGKAIIGGSFVNINNIARNNIARINQDGTLDETFQPPLISFDDEIFDILVLPDDKFFAVGRFTFPGKNIAKFNADGTKDQSFITNQTMDEWITKIKLLPDGKVLIGGAFTHINNVAAFRVARLNSDGTLDDSFLGSVDNQVVNDIYVQPDNKIIIGGSFSAIAGTPRTGLARLNSDGTLDSTFNPQIDNPFILSIQPTIDDKIIIGGQFSAVGGVARKSIVKLNMDGTTDDSFDAKMTGSAVINHIIPLINEKYLIGGMVNSVDGVQVSKNLARLNPDGTLDNSFSIEVSDGFVNQLAVSPILDNLTVVGPFSEVEGSQVDSIARFSGYFTSEGENYLMKSKELGFDELVGIDGGIALESGQFLIIETRNHSSQGVIIQAYGLEETI